MNYYERHIGDYLKDTSHLSLLEHGIYTRLLDVYYTREGAIPDDQVARLIGARSKDEREALQAVLTEFFQRTADGWVQTRCEREIERFKDGEPEREAKKANEDNRLRRHREERARLFKVLTDAGMHAPWNVSMSDLRELVKRHAATQPATAPETQLPPLPATAPATPATATQTPLPNTHTPEEIPEPPTVVVGKASPPRPPDCPTDDLIRLYHERLPMLPRVEVLNDSRRRALSARWREVVTDPDIRKATDPKAAALDWFDWFFGHAAKSPFLTGRTKDWRADFDFLLTPSKFAKVVEGSYHKEHA